MKREAALSAFMKIWEQLFSTPVHLDSALSKQPPAFKAYLARSLHSILMRPTSLAQEVGVGIKSGEPWSLIPQEFKQWRSAQLMSERLWEMRADGDLKEYESFPEDFPPHLIEAWTKEWGEKVSHALMKTLSQDAPLGIRVSRHFNRKEILASLSSVIPVPAALSDLAPYGIRIRSYAQILGTDAFKKGAFEIQDEGSQVMALFALWPELFSSYLKSEPSSVKSLNISAPKDAPSWTVVDACAGAGGKTLALADAISGKGQVFAYDTSEKKIAALKRRASRAGLRNIKGVVVTEGKEEELISKFRRRADVVLVDAPCSGWGVLRRNPDIKWRQKPDVLERMPKIQARLLSLYSELVAPGGRLVYGVCTFRKAETVDITKEFVLARPEFKPGQGGFLGPGPCDGFYMQVFQRAK